MRKLHSTEVIAIKDFTDFILLSFAKVQKLSKSLSVKNVFAFISSTVHMQIGCKINSEVQIETVNEFR